MAFVIGLSVRGAKAAYKAYKKHEAEKDLQARGVMYEVPDQIPEQVPPYYYNGGGSYYEEAAYGTTTANNTSTNPFASTPVMVSSSSASSLSGSRSRSPNNHNNSSGTTLRRHHRDRSNASMNSASSSSSDEIDAQLENDVEFQRFMQRQKQAYLDQRRMKNGNNNGRGSTGSFESAGVSSTATTRQAPPPPNWCPPASAPPAYDVAVAQGQGDGLQRRSRVQPVVHASHPAVAELSDEEAYVVSPVTPVSQYRRSRSSELETGTVSTLAPPPAGPVTELPAAPHQSSSRFPVEMPTVTL